MKGTLERKVAAEDNGLCGVIRVQILGPEWMSGGFLLRRCPSGRTGLAIPDNRERSVNPLRLSACYFDAQIVCHSLCGQTSS